MRSSSSRSLICFFHFSKNLVSSLAIPFLPRLDYSFISETANKLVAERRYAQNVSIISGNNWDEGTILTLGTGLNITTSEALDNWLATTFSPNSTSEQRTRLLELYPEDVTQGSPFDTGDLYALAPQSKRIAAILGDEVFQAPRRAFMNQTKETQPTWGYAFRAFKNTPVIGSFHSADVSALYGARPGPPGDEMRQRWIQFAYSLDRKFYFLFE
jgi:carboxylesterase type B